MFICPCLKAHSISNELFLFCFVQFSLNVVNACLRKINALSFRLVLALQIPFFPLSHFFTFFMTHSFFFVPTENEKQRKQKHFGGFLMHSGFFCVWQFGLEIRQVAQRG